MKLHQRFALSSLAVGLLFCVNASAQDHGEEDFRASQFEWSRSARPPVGRAARSGVVEATVQESSTAANAAQLWAISLQDKTLYRVMRRWAAQAQYQLVWQVDRDFPIESEVVFEGSFRKAVAEVMSGVSMTDYPLQAIFNPDTRVLRVIRFLEERSSGVPR